MSGAPLHPLHVASMAAPEVRAFLLAHHPGAARAIARRLADARRRGLWHARRNDLDADLADLIAEAGSAREAAE